MSQTPEELDRKIKEAREKHGSKPSAEGKGAPSGMGGALRAGTDLVSALVVGGFLGYWIDNWLDTKPWSMIVFLFLGFAAGFLNIYRSQTGQDYRIGFRKTTNDKD
ncbi:MAG: AtpZ/AtpI family protein [Pseudomonadota bacterium]